MRSLLLIVVATGCYGVDEIDGTWEPVATITGQLTVEIGPAPSLLAAPTDGVLRIASWNVFRAPDPALLAAEFHASAELSRADVILLQELEVHDGEDGTRARRLAEALGMTWVYAPARFEDGYLHGIALASRYPIVDARVMRLPEGRAAFEEVNDRNAIAAEIDLGTTTITVANTHLDVQLGPIDRIRQLHPCATQIPEAVVLGGDFNTNPWAWISGTVPLTSTEAIVGQDQATILDDYMTELGFVVPIAPDQSTFNRAPLDHMRLDNVYVRGYPVVRQGIATDVAGSDHWPIWVDLMLQ